MVVPGHCYIIVCIPNYAVRKYGLVTIVWRIFQQETAHQQLTHVHIEHSVNVNDDMDIVQQPFIEFDLR